MPTGMADVAHPVDATGSPVGTASPAPTIERPASSGDGPRCAIPPHATAEPAVRGRSPALSGADPMAGTASGETSRSPWVPGGATSTSAWDARPHLQVSARRVCSVSARSTRALPPDHAAGGHPCPRMAVLARPGCGHRTTAARVATTRATRAPVGLEPADGPPAGRAVRAAPASQYPVRSRARTTGPRPLPRPP